MSNYILDCAKTVIGFIFFIVGGVLIIFGDILFEINNISFFGFVFLVIGMILWFIILKSEYEEENYYSSKIR